MKQVDIDERRFIPLISDYGFKATFGNEANTLFLRVALQALIKADVAIEEIKFLPTEQKGLTIDSRSSIYDLACRDANGNFFIVEMQLSEYPEFIHRMKLYSLFRFTTMVKQGKYKFENLPKIYCIGILAKTIFPLIDDYHNVAILRNEKGELIDDQMSFITVELTKFDKQIVDIQEDLDKLIYTMKTIHTVTEPTQYPAFWTEEWLQLAINELDKRSMTSEQLLDYEMTLSANALALKNEEKKVAKAIEKALLGGKLTIDKIADYNDVPVDFVLEVQTRLNKKQ